MDPLGTNMYLLKRYRPSDSFRTFISESVVHLSSCLMYSINQSVFQPKERRQIKPLISIYHLAFTSGKSSRAQLVSALEKTLDFTSMFE